MLRVPKSRGGPSANSSMKPKSTKSGTSITSTSKKGSCKLGAGGGAPPPQKNEDAFTFPAFSVPLPKKQKNAQEAEKMKKKMMRRNKPKGEDVAKMKEITRSVQGKHITVMEYIGLISPSSGDNGELLRVALADELATFRAASRKIYETMTQDVSDVLTNEHIQMTEMTQEKQQMYTDRMRMNMNEVYQLIPDFDFEKFYTMEGYLLEKFPLAPKMEESSEEMQAILRQEAYYRYQWLKSEGDRLKEENTSLQARLTQLKKQQHQELLAVAQREKQAEVERNKLVETQEELEDRLEDLSFSLEKSLVETEIETGELAQQKVEKQIATERRKAQRTKQEEERKTVVSRQKKPEWSSEVAADIEATIAKEALQSETSKMSMRSRSKTSIKARGRRVTKRGPPQQQQARERSPFHYSPVKTPPRQQQQGKSSSPFHYSPPKTPPEYYAPQQQQQQQQMGGQYEPESSHRVRMETATTTTINEQQQRTVRQSRGPADTWGGFY